MIGVHAVAAIDHAVIEGRMRQAKMHDVSRCQLSMVVEAKRLTLWVVSESALVSDMENHDRRFCASLVNIVSVTNLRTLIALEAHRQSPLFT